MYMPKASKKKALELERVNDNLRHKDIRKNIYDTEPNDTSSVMYKKKPGEYIRPWRAAIEQDLKRG